MASNKQLVQQDILQTTDLNAVDSGYIGFGAKDDGLYQREYNKQAKKLALQESFTLSNSLSGFINESSITVSYNYINRQITLTGDLSYMYQGEVKSLTSPWTSSAHTATVGSWYLSSTDGINFTWTQTQWVFTNIMVAYVNYQASALNSFAIRETHGLMDYHTHEELHNQIGTYRVSGGQVTANTIAFNTATDAANSPGFDAATVKDEDLKSIVTAWTEGTYTRMYIGAGNVAVFDTTATLPFIATANTYIQVNNTTTGALTAGLIGNYYNVYQILVPTTSDSDSLKYRMIMLQPQFTYTSLLAAQSEDPQILSLGNLSNLTPEFIIYTRITYYTSASNSNIGKCTIPTNGITYIVGNKASQINVGGFTVNNHVTLSNLTWTLSGHIGTANKIAAFDETGLATELTKNTGFNLALGTTAGTVAEGNHNHSLSSLSEKSYNSLTDKPTLLSQFTNDLSISSSQVTTALGYTPYSSANPSGYATTNYVDTSITNLIGGAPASLNTLREIADSLNNNTALESTLINSIALKANQSSEYVYDLSTGNYETADVHLATIAETADYASSASSASSATYASNDEHGNNISNTYLKLVGGTMSNTNKVINLNADLFDSIDSDKFIYGDNSIGVKFLEELDVDTILKAGFYSLYQTTNAPFTGDGGLINIPAWKSNNVNEKYNFQIASNIGNDAKFYMRNTNSNGSGTWRELYHTGNFTPSDYLPVGGTALYSDVVAINNSITYGKSGLQFGQTYGKSGTGLNDNPFEDWFSHIVLNHSNPNGYHQQISTCFHSDDVYYRRLVGGEYSDYKRFLFDGDAITSNNLSIDGTNEQSLTFKRNGVSKTWGLGSDAHGFYFTNLTDSVLPIYIKNGGNVGIGNVSPTEKLDVNGKIKTTELIDDSKLKSYGFPSGVARWVRIAKLKSPLTGEAYGTISINNSYHHNSPSPITFTFGTGYRGTNTFINQLGGYNSIFDKVRIVYPTDSDNDYYIEVFSNATILGNIFNISLSNSNNVELYSNYNDGSIPSNYSIYQVNLINGVNIDGQLIANGNFEFGNPNIDANLYIRGRVGTSYGWNINNNSGGLKFKSDKSDNAYINIDFDGQLRQRSIDGWGNNIDYYINKNLGNRNDYIQHVILLHEIYNGTLINRFHCNGTITASRGGTDSGLINDTYHVNTSAAYSEVYGALNCSNGVGELVTCMYGGKKYIALKPFYRVSAVGYTFVGNVYSTGEFLKIVSYRKSNTGAIWDYEINNSITTYQNELNLTAKGLYFPNGNSITNDSSYTNLSGSLSIIKANTFGVLKVSSTFGNPSYISYNIGESEPRFYNNGSSIWFGSGSATVDVGISRSSTYTLLIAGNRANGNLSVQGNLTIGGTLSAGYINATHWENYAKPINFATDMYSGSNFEDAPDLDGILTIGESVFGFDIINKPSTAYGSGYAWNTAGGDTTDRGIQFYATYETNSKMYSREMSTKTWKEFVFKEDDLYLTKNISTVSKTANFTLALTDSGKKIDVNAASTVTCTIPNSSTVSFPVGAQIIFKQLNAQIYFVNASGVTIHSEGGKYYSRNQYAVCQLIYEGSNVWTLFGNLISQ